LNKTLISHESMHNLTYNLGLKELRLAF